MDVCTVSLGGVEEEQWRLLVESIVCGLRFVEKMKNGIKVRKV